MAHSSLRSITGGRDVRRTTRQTLPEPRGEGLPGSGTLEGTIRGHQVRQRAGRRINRIQSRLPSYLSERPAMRIGVPLDDALGTLRFRRGRDLLSLDPSVAYNLAGGLPRDRELIPRDPQEQKQAQQVLLHELVHANQPEPVTRKVAKGRLRTSYPQHEWEVEGGAELLSRKLAREMFGLREPLGAYQPYVRQVKRSGGAQSVIRSLLGPER